MIGAFFSMVPVLNHLWFRTKFIFFL